MTKEHTPTPWYSIGNDIYHESEYGSDPIASVCGECSFTQDHANAAHIVKCVNMHDELVEAIQELICAGDFRRGCEDLKSARETLKKAGAL